MTRFLLWIEGIASWTGVILFLGLMIIGFRNNHILKKGVT